MSNSGEGESGAHIPSDAVFADPQCELRWRSRIRAPRIGVPVNARHHTGRSVYRNSISGVPEIFTWDRDTGEHRQATRRDRGTRLAAIAANGAAVWWFADNDGAELGRWRCQPFSFMVGDDPRLQRDAVPEAEDGYPAGIAMGSESAIVGLQSSRGSEIWRRDGDSAAELIYRHKQYGLIVIDITGDESLVAIDHCEHGDPRNTALCVMTKSGDRLAELRDLGTELHGLGFNPAHSRSELLVAHNRHGRRGILTWDPADGNIHELDMPLSGDLTASWTADGASLIVRQNYTGRSRLYTYRLSDGHLEELGVPAGSVADDVRSRSDGTVEYVWSSSAHPWTLRQIDTSGRDHVAAVDGTFEVPLGVAIVDAWIDGPAGPIHTLISKPPTVVAGNPQPTIFRLHGGPHTADTDSFDAMRSAWTDAGFTVVQPNYRGSTGYTSQWRDAIVGRPGITELEDVHAVHDWCIRCGISDPSRCVIEGFSWGGYLAVLAAGIQPQRWAAVIGGLPLVDVEAVYHETMPPLRALFAQLFGGTPRERADVYRESSPITYVSRIRAPLLLIAGLRDPRSPMPQVNSFIKALEQAGRSVRLITLDTGHGPPDAHTTERITAASIRFARDAIATRPLSEGSQPRSTNGCF